MNGISTALPVSVVIPCFDCAHTIERAVTSVATQRQRPQEVIVVDDASGDCLDAVLCLMQAAWAQQRHAEGDALYGLPPGLDPLEGWIVTAESDARSITENRSG